MSDRLGQVVAAAQSSWLGEVDFLRAHQHNLKQADFSRQDGRARLIWFEPKSPVLTLGRRLHGDRATEIAQTLRFCRARKIAVIEADRGGQATLHLPGQLVLFVAIPGRREEVSALISKLFVAIESLDFLKDIDLRRGEGDQTGLWIGAAKIVSVGLRVEHGVIRHGLSFNVAIDPSIADGLTLCGHRDASYADLRSIVSDRHDRRPPQFSVKRVASALHAILCGPTALVDVKLDGP